MPLSEDKDVSTFPVWNAATGDNDRFPTCETIAGRNERRRNPATVSNGDTLQAAMAPLARLWRRPATVADAKPESAEAALSQRPCEDAQR